MKKIFLSIVSVALAMPFLTSCIQEIDPQTSYVTQKQASETPWLSRVLARRWMVA